MQTKLGVFRSLFSRKFDEISPRNVVKALANFRRVKRNFAVTLAEATFRRRKNSQLRNFAEGEFAAPKFPQSEILLAVQEGCNENLLFGPL